MTTVTTEGNARRAELVFDASATTAASLELNGVPCVRSIVVFTPERLHGASLVIAIDGTEAIPYERGIETVPAGGSLAVDVSDFMVPAALVSRATERIVLDLTARLLDASGSVLAAEQHRLAVIPATHWCGTQEACESLATFVTPNAGALREVLLDASRLLEQRTKAGHLDGYLSGSPERAQRIAEACFEALAARGPTYITAKPSFEDAGQKVRTASEVLSEGAGNCLDLSVTLAALLEACGLRAAIALGDGHAVVGFATIDESFPDAVHEGPSRLVNRIELGEFRVIEATHACNARASFGEALAEGTRFMRSASDAMRVLDVSAARRAGFHPFAEEQPGDLVPMSTRRPVRTTEWAVVRPAELPPLPKPQPGRVHARLEVWKKRLLDLTLRNRLLNDRPRFGIPLFLEGDPSLARLEDHLWNEKPMKLVPRGSMQARDADAASEEFARGWLRADLTDAELFTRATKAFREGRSSLEETGARSLYVAVGALEYRVEGRAEPVRAPLLLVPVEMERISRSEGYRVTPVAEDTVPNVALVEYLRNAHGLDIGLADALEEDESGIDVPAILARVRKAVSDVPGARVIAEAKLGNYSFKKLPIFEEMRARGAELGEHRVVRSLLDRSASESIRRVALISPDAVDTAAPFASVRLPLPADSSQVAAIASATAGATFVLQGPPGTGKSQTITNLLAECLARGKRVLFIAEKSAALEVVSERLRRTGLALYALDLHADHATKPSFVAQMKRSLEELDGPASAGSRSFRSLADGLDRTRVRLANACDAMHGEHRGMTVHAAIERAAELADTTTAAQRARLEPALDGVLPREVAEEDILDRTRCAEGLARACAALPAGAAERFGDTAPRAQLTAEQAVHLSRLAADALDLLDELERTMRACASLLFVDPPGRPAMAGSLSAVADAFAIRMPGAALLVESALATDHAARIGRIRKALSSARTGDRALAEVTGRYDRTVLDLPLEQWIGDLRATRDRFILWRWLAARKVRSQLVRLAHKPPPNAHDKLLQECEQIAAAREAIRAGEAARAELTPFADAEGSIDLAATMKTLEAAGEAARVLRAHFPTEAAKVRDHLGASVGHPELSAHASALAKTLASLGEILEELEQDLAPTPAYGDESATFASLGARLATLRDHWQDLPPWSACSVARIRAEELGLAAVSQMILGGTLAGRDAPRATESALLAAWVRARFREEAPLADCSAEQSDRLRGEFHAAMQDYRRGAPAAVLAALRERTRKALDADAADESMRSAIRTVNTLRAVTTIRRPIRRVMREGAPAIAALKPIVLASPLSATTLLPPEFPPFDIVVFDEASQVPVWDAACAISRGHASVIVGDSKQLPPTNFFERKDPEGDRAGAEGDDDALAGDALEPLDSVLDAAIGSGFRQQSLLWHYRSRDERLIEFSNRRSYGGRLQTFPAAHRAHPNLGVEFRFVEGTYDRARSATNRAEAEAIVAEISRRVLDDDDCTANRSIGVVTFSVAQQTLVQDLLDEAIDRDPALRERMAESAKRGEEVFVKNLENVQGDERATMLFSICYGRDANGALYHNFGPLNLEGGERRLNVAVTRAREKIVLFSTIRANDLDRNKCTAAGVRDLRDYLAFAEHGTVPPLAQEGATGGEVDVGSVERAIAAALEARGWRVDLHVGRSRDYRVSLAVADRAAPDHWLLGIEMDGAFYGAAPSVIDREIVREGVLGALGWRVLRISALDWLRDQARVLDRIETTIRG